MYYGLYVYNIIEKKTTIATKRKIFFCNLILKFKFDYTET